MSCKDYVLELNGKRTKDEKARLIKMKENKQPMEEVQLQNISLIDVIESLTYPLYVIGVNDYKILLANSAASVSGLPENATCYMVSHKRDKPCDGTDDPCPLDEAKRTGKPVVVEHVHYDRNSNPINVEVHAYPIFDNCGNVSSVIEYSLDITERKKMEEGLRQAKEKTEQINEELRKTIALANHMAVQAETSNLAKSEFLANMSHEIRTPMNAIVGFSSILADEKITAEHKEFVNIIQDSAENLLKVIDDILDFSKIEAGQIDIELQDCSLDDMLKAIGSLMSLRAKEKDIDFEIIKDDGLPHQIRTDPTRVRQCLINLVGNA
ncbi:MAG: histidine kinase dimerization/phospho-acceptor domain-containing protein, partial [Planctomycetota bacterium]